MHKEGALFPLATARHKYEIDMCTGSLPQKILLFSLPLMATGMLQLLFNAADIIVVGRYVGSHALAAVGSAYALMTFLTSIFLGLSMGAGALFSIALGQKDEARLRRAVAHAFGLIVSVTLVLS